MSTAREGLTPAAPGRAEAGTAAVPREAARRRAAALPVPAPATLPAATASRARALAALPRTCPLADPDLASSGAPTATISGAAAMWAAYPGPGSPP